MRKGLLRELVGGKAQWVRALDGVSFDVRRGEVFCLVGESGCGKTTTAKAILRLVDATGGDIFLEMPKDEFLRYEAAAGKSDDADAAKIKDGLRRRYSLTWKETIPWTMRQVLTLAGFLLAGFFVAIGAFSEAVGLLSTPFTNSWATLGTSVGLGFILGFIGTMPPSRPHRRTAVVLAGLAILAAVLLPIPTYLFYGVRGGGSAGAFDAGDALGRAWGDDLFGMLLAVIFAPMIAGGVARVVISARQQAEGLAGIRMRALRKRMQLIFQDPYESLNPKQSVFEIVSEPLQVNRIATAPEEINSLVEGALKDTGLRPPEEFMFRFPHELSGGQRQRVSIASALVLQPDFILADEPVSMLDVSIRTEILQLMMDLRKSRGITYLFITHDLSLAWVLADRVAVMYLGKIVELGTVEQVIGTPKHPYTQALISVVPSPDPRKKMQRMILKGERPDPVNIPTGCRFHPRCPAAFEKCGWNADEVAEELKEAQMEIAGRLRATIAERLGRATDLRQSAKEQPSGASAQEAEAAALEAQAQSLEPGLRRAETFAASVRVQDPRTLALVPPTGMSPSDLAQSLRELFAAQRDTRRAFYGVADVSDAAGDVRVGLHEWSEPPLLEIAPENLVACHLVTPDVPRPAPAAATPT